MYVQIIAENSQIEGISLYLCCEDECFKLSGIFEGEVSIMIFDRHVNLKYKFGNRYFQSEGYYVSTVGLNEASIIAQHDCASGQSRSGNAAIVRQEWIFKPGAIGITLQKRITTIGSVEFAKPAAWISFRKVHRLLLRFPRNFQQQFLQQKRHLSDRFLPVNHPWPAYAEYMRFQLTYIGGYAQTPRGGCCLC